MVWVAPHLTGGLGNRLFIYAAAAGLAEKWKCDAVFFLPRCGETSHGAFDNIFRLFPQTPLVLTEPEWEVLSEPPSSMYKYFPFPSEPLKKNAVIQGWRQTSKYFPSTGIHPKFESALTQEQLEKFKISSPLTTWFLHVRLGDYKILPHHQVDLGRYYLKCLSQVPKGHRVLFFSDEPHLCAEQFQRVCGQLELKFDVFQSKDELESLYAMSQCKGGAITANSTFSWWGSYLAHHNSPSEFRAFYPSRWGQRMPPPVDIVPEWGICVDVDD
jgi:hypothetical protein